MGLKRMMLNGTNLFNMKTNLLFEQCLSKVDPEIMKEVQNNMKTKEERARESVTWDCDSEEFNSFVDQYIKGATEQEVIDNKNLSQRINRLFGESGGAEIDGSWWSIDEIEEFLTVTAIEEE